MARERSGVGSIWRAARWARDRLPWLREWPPSSATSRELRSRIERIRGDDDRPATLRCRRIAQLLQQFNVDPSLLARKRLSNFLPGARQARRHRPDRNRKCLGNLLVAHFL